MHIGSFTPGQLITYSNIFIDQWGQPSDPASPTATLIDPSGDSTLLTAPTKQNSITGLCGDTIDTTGFTEYGEYRLIITGVVPNLINVVVIQTFILEADESILSSNLASLFDGTGILSLKSITANNNSGTAMSLISSSSGGNGLSISTTNGNGINVVAGGLGRTGIYSSGPMYGLWTRGDSGPGLVIESLTDDGLFITAAISGIEIYTSSVTEPAINMNGSISATELILEEDLDVNVISIADYLIENPATDIGISTTDIRSELETELARIDVTISSRAETTLVEQLTQTGYLVVGQGRGSKIFTDIITNAGIAQVNIVVKAYLVTNDVIDWSVIKGMHKSDSNGSFTLYLNPGSYILTFEKDGKQIGTQIKTIS